MMCVYLFGVLAAIQILPGLSWNKHMEVPGMYQGDIQLTPEQWEHVKKGQNAFGSIRGRRWPGGKIPYQIESSIGDKGRQAIASAIADYHKYTCLRFHKRQPHERYYISFFSGKGCNSPVGRSSHNRISLEYPGCQDKGTVLHEIGHSIGLQHEQCRPDRDRYVTVHYGNINDRHWAFAFNIDNNIDSLRTPYDLKSMMHYSSTAFAWPGRKTITTKDKSKQHLIDTYNRITGFSEIDIKQIGLMYQSECSRGGSGCQGDKNRSCPSWARSGYCRDQRYKTMMERDCCKSCGSS